MSKKCPTDSLLCTCNQIAECAANVTNSQVGILYLTAEQKVLEAVGRGGERLDPVPGVDIPFYRLDWDIIPEYEFMYDGFTAWCAVHLRPGHYDIRRMDGVLNRHPAWRGQWDPIVWRGEAERQLDRILAVAIGSETEDSPYRCYGLLKVERQLTAAGSQGNAYSMEEVEQIIVMAASIRDWFLADPARERRFWRAQCQAMAQRKAAELLALFARGRSMRCNITEGLGFIMEFLRMYLGAEHAFHVFEGQPDAGEAWHDAAVMPYWRPAYREATWSTRRDEEDLGTSHPPYQPGADAPWRMARGGGLLAPENWVAVQRSWEELLAKVAEARAGGATGTVTDVPLGLAQPVLLPCDADKPAEVLCGSAKLIRLLSGDRDLGTVIIPQPPDMGSAVARTPRGAPATGVKSPDVSNEDLGVIASTLSRTFDGLLSSQYDIPLRPPRTPRLPPIYLPRLREIGPKWVAILFADIRNFSTVTKILRLLGKRAEGALELLMDVHALEMARTIARWGRRDKFMGDGLMAIFGEDLDGENEGDRERMVKHALCCACEMVLVFAQIKALWLSGDIDSSRLPWRPPPAQPDFTWRAIQREFNENIDFDIGIGINFGQAYFDYFGDLRRREYTPIGDQVNLAKRLEEEACRWDEQLGRYRAPILLSQTAWSYAWDEGNGFLLSPTLNSRNLCWPLTTGLKGQKFDYNVYEMDPNILNVDSVKQQPEQLQQGEGPDQIPFRQTADAVTLSDERQKQLDELKRPPTGTAGSGSG
jgi:class 3 adenylate cyclase